MATEVLPADEPVELEATPVSPPPPPSDPIANEKGQKKKRPLWVFALGGLIGLCLCGFIFAGILRGVAAGTAEEFENTAATIESIADSPEFEKEIQNIEQLFEDVEPPAPPPIHQPRPIAELEKIVADNPEDNQTRIELASAYIQAGNPEAARELIRGNTPFSRNPVGFLTATNRLMENEEYDLAIFILEEGHAKFKDNSEIQQTLIMAYILNEVNPDRIADYLNTLETTSASNITVDLGEAYLAYTNDDDFAYSTQILNEALANSDRKAAPFILFLKGSLEAENDAFSAAHETFSAAKALPSPPWLTTLIQQNIVELEQ